MRLQFPRLILVLALLIIPTAAYAQLSWSVAEAQPNVPEGGRASTIAVNPAQPLTILVASESGGLFRSTNGGLNWQHVDALPEYSTNAVGFLAANPDIALLTANADWRTTNGGGIWRSADRGLTWTQVYMPPPPAGLADRFSAREIAVAADTGAIYVATNYGVAISTDLGVTWRLVEPYGASYRNIISVAAQQGGVVLSGSPFGLRRSTDGGTSWTNPTGFTGGVGDLHALAAAPISRNLFFGVDASTRLWVSEDAGATFTQITSAATGGGGCGGITFIKPITRRALIPTRPGLTLYFGNRCNVYRQFPPRNPLTGRFDYSAAWTTLSIDHSDTRDLGFNGTRPILLATDGGLHSTADGGANWTFVGGGAGGYNALQITEVISQKVTSSGETDIYYGTQDNNVRATLSPDKTYPAARCCEGFYMDAQHRITNDSDSQVTFTACWPCSRWRSGRRFGGIAGWSDPPSTLGDIKLVRKNFHVQPVDDSATLDRGFAVTRNLSFTWSQWGTFAEGPRSIAHKSVSTRFLGGRPLFSTVVYQAINTGFDFARNFEITRLLKVREGLLSSATVSYPAMNNFGGLGINPTMFAWYQVFAVDPANPSFLLAPDVIDNQMKESRDGGQNWTVRTDLTSLVTDSGAYRFSDWAFPHASAISFSEDNPDFVAIGTHQGGILVSTDRGTSFAKVPGSEKVTYITSINWLAPGSAMISTYGRGLWALVRRFRLPPFYDYCRLPCWLRVFPWGGDNPRGIIDPLWDPVPFRLQRSLIVIDGRILGAKTKGTRLTELTVTPGSQLAWRGTGEPPTFTLRIADKGQGLPLRQLSRRMVRGGPIVGVALGRNDQPIGLIRSNRLISSAVLPQEKSRPNPAQGEDVREATKSPYAQNPVVEIVGAGAANRVRAGQTIQIRARNIRAGSLVVLLIDGTVAARGKPAEDGSVLLRATAPREQGMHTIIVADASGKPLAGANFLVVHEDEKEERGAARLRSR